MDQSPLHQTFTHKGKTYRINNEALSGRCLDLINSAVYQSRVDKAMAALPAVIAKREAQDETTPESERTAVNFMLDRLMAPVSNFVPLTLIEIGAAIKDNPTVVATVLHYSCAECETLAEAQEIVSSYPDFHVISLKCFIASGAKALGKSPVLKALLQAERTVSGGADPPQEDSSSAPVLLAPATSGS